MDSRTQRASGTVVDPRASLAMWLRTGRTQKNLSLDEVARITKIQRRILEKLEAGNLEGLPADVFVKGFVRSFAKCCGLDAQEAIERLSAAQTGQPTATTAVARAFVDSMSVRVVQATPSTPVALVSEPVEPEAPVEVAPAAPASARTIEVIEIVDVAALAPIAPVATATVPAAATSDEPTSLAADDAFEAAADSVTPKKKRSRRSRSRKNKRTEGTIVAEAVVETMLDAAAPAVADAEVIEAALSAAAVRETPAEGTTAVASPSAPVDSTVASPTLAEGSVRISSSDIAVVDVAAETASSTDAVSAAQDIAGTWQPTMPPLSTAPSVPWRRPQLRETAAYVQPHLVIDDADPDSADRQREDRNEREQSRLSFLPPILLDREDRSARQGGLTLAVIILLIAATLTLSYLMRRPSARGEGVTMLDGQSQLIG